MNIFILKTPHLQGLIAHAGVSPYQSIDDRFNEKSGYKVLGDTAGEPIVATNHSMEETLKWGEGLIAGVEEFPDPEAVFPQYFR
jgi:hypothetical protein